MTEKNMPKCQNRWPGANLRLNSVKLLKKNNYNDIVTLFKSLQGCFPNLHPACTPLSNTSLIALVR